MSRSSRMRVIPGAVGAVVVVATLVGCGSSPAEQRAEHITRLTESLQARLDLSPTQVECFRVGLDQLSDDDLAQAVSDQPSPAVQDAIVAIGLACYEPKSGTE